MRLIPGTATVAAAAAVAVVLLASVVSAEWVEVGVVEHRLGLSGPWSERGLLSRAENGSYSISGQAPPPTDLADAAWYQVKLGDSIASIKACHLRQLPVEDELTIHERLHAPYALSYRVRDITLAHNGCPLPKSIKKRNLVRRRSAKPQPPSPHPTRFDTHLLSTQPQHPPAPPLKQPLPTMQDGSIAQPPPEKSFIQKYWIYLIPVAILLLMPPAEDEKKDPAAGAEAHPSSSQPGNGQGARRIK